MTASVVEDRREVFGWMVYDWANSTFPTVVVSTLLGPYLTGLAQSAVGENGRVLGVGAFVAVTAKSFFPFCVALSVLLQVFLLPLLGAIADYSQLKKRLMVVFCYAGVTATCLLFFVTGSLYPLGGLLFVVANLSFGAAGVLYNAFLGEIVPEARRDAVSSRGFALGYLGGGLLLAASFLLMCVAPRLGISVGLAVRLSLLAAGLWWGGFALVTFACLRSRAAQRQLPPGATYLSVGWSELANAVRELRRLPSTLRYLVAYLFYNDGIQTVVSMASVLLAQELFVARGLPVDQAFLLELFLMVQFVALAGALLFERLATLVGTKRAILTALAGWCGAVIFAYASLRTTGQAWLLAAVIATVLGGSQALSRSLFSRMIPAGREASFFGLYEISDRGTSWMGPLLFGIVVAVTNSYRQAMLSLILLFVAGTLLLVLTDTDRAEREAGGAAPENTDVPALAPSAA
jgi:UMF1 family MFS transporter